MRHHILWNLLGIFILTIVCFGCRNKKASLSKNSSALLLRSHRSGHPVSQRDLSVRVDMLRWRQWVQSAPDVASKIQRLSHVSRRNAAAASIVGEALRDNNVKVRRWSVWLLGTMAEKYTTAIPWLIRATQSPEPRLKEWASGYLQDLPHPKRFSAFHKFLQHPNREVRVWSARSIRRIAARVQSRIRGILPVLVNMAAHKYWREKVAVAALLHRIGTFPLRVDDRKQVNATLILLLHSKDWRVRRAAIRALALLGARSVEAVPALRVAATFDKFWYARQEASEAIQHIRTAFSLRAAR